MFTNTGFSDNLEAKGIEELINEFSINTNCFKQSMKSIDVSSKLGEYNRNKRNEDWISDNNEITASAKVPKESIKLFNKVNVGDRKIGPIKAERILLK